MKTQRFIIALTILYSCFANSIIAQNKEAPNWLLNETISGNQTYVARESITLQKGFSYKSAGNSFLGKIDRFLVFPPDSNTYALPNGTITTNPTLGAMVGNFSGSLDVSPSGAATYTIPIECPPGINGMQPNISLVYNSQSGNGIAGWGFNIGGLSSISRVPRTIYSDGAANGIKDRINDAYALDGNRLIWDPNSSSSYGNHGSVFYTEMEMFSRITIHPNVVGPGWFKVQAKDGSIYNYGSGQGKLSYQGAEQAWMLDFVQNTTGQTMIYEYDHSDTLYAYVNKIIYGHNGKDTIEFFYQPRFDSIPIHYDIKTGYITKRLFRIVTKTAGQIYRQYDLTYKQDIFSRLEKITVKNGAGEFLNPIVFEWGSYPTTHSTMTLSDDINISLSSGISENFVTSLDWNGDGLADIVNLYAVKNGAAVAVQVDVLTTSKTANGGLSFVKSFFTPEIVQEFYFDKAYLFEKEFKKHIRQNGGLLSGDLYGKGMSQIVLPYYQSSGGHRVGFYIYGSKVASKIFTKVLNHSQSLPVITVADLDNNGKSEIIYIEKIEKSRSDGKFHTNIDVLSEIGASDNIPYISTIIPSIRLSAKPERIYVADFDGDGMQDIMIVTKEDYTIFWNQGGTLSTSLFSDSFKTTRTEFNSDYDYIEMGDFNGDGLPDFIVKDNKSFKWYRLMNNGNKTFKSIESKELGNREIKVDSNYEDKNRCFVLDLNHDGKSDLIISDATKLLNEITHKVYWYRFCDLLGDFAPMNSSYLTRYTSEADTLAQNLVIGDFNGIGRQELVAYGLNCWNGTYPNYGNQNLPQTKKWRRYSNNAFTEQSGKVIAIIDGMKNKTTIEYAPLTDNTVFSKMGEALFPAIDIQVALAVVKKVASLVGINPADTTKYEYRGARFHLQGKGFLGFEEITAENKFLNRKIITQYGHTYTPKNENITYYFPYLSEQNVRTVNGTVISETKNTYGYITFPNNNSKRIFQYVAEQIVADSLKGVTAVVKASGYDNRGNPGSITTTRGNLTEIQTLSYVQRGSWCVNKPDSIQVERKFSGDTHKRISAFEYDNITGNLTKETIDPNDINNKVVTEYKDFNTFGQATKIEVTANSVTNGIPNSVTRTSQITYSPCGRFIKTKKNVLGETTTYNWDEVKGQLNSSIDYQGRTTSYNYDNWGRLKLTTYPDGIKIAHTLQWAGTIAGKPDNAKYYSYTETSGESPVWVWYDNLGREIRRDSYGLNNKKVMVDTEYYNTTDANMGRLWRVSEPYFAGQATTYSVTYNTYDIYGRCTQLTTPLGATNYNYDKLITTVSSPSGTRKTTLNTAGWVVIEETNGKKVDFTHYASGLVKTATPQDGKAITMEYDLQGNRTKLTDPSAGVITSKYDGWGQLNWSEQVIHANTTTPVRTNYVYQASGLLSSKSRSGVTTTYSYNSRNLLTGISMPGHSQTFTYDNYDRVIQTRDNADKSFTHQTEYDIFGRISKETYPSGYFVLNEYDNNGYLTKITDSKNVHIWEALESNARGQLTKTKSGTREKTYGFDSRGFPTSIFSSGIMNLGYIFDGKGNLTNRRDMTSSNVSNNFEEIFQYDSMDRLQRYDVRRNSTSGWLNGTSDRIDYNATTGNISYKSDFNASMSYGENPYPPQALTSIPYVPSSHANVAQAQTLTYTDFKKVSQITENSHTLNITYGVDEQRIKSILSRPSSNPSLSRWYLGNYEEEMLSGNANIRRIHYISGGNGLAAIYVQNTSPARDTLYYAHTDYQGSLLALSLANGTVRERYAYDPWGKRRNPDNWTQADTRKSFIIDRGYTMHEHLTDFNLINMNGRVYDPLTAQFLSPDPYIQAPSNWINYNRYAYVLFNPTKYTDPTGELFWVIPNIGWSKEGGLNIGLNVIVGLPGILSLQAGIGYSFKSNDFNVNVGATAAFNTVYTSYSTQSGFNAGWSLGLSPQMGFPVSTNFFSTGINYNITHDSWIANVSAWGVDKNGWTFNPSASVMIYPEHTTNWVRGKGFNSNDKVLDNFIKGRYDKDWSDDIGTGGANWYNAALKYFGFEGTYDPSIDGVGQFDPNDGSIKYRAAAFNQGYDYLRAVATEELFHAKDYLYALNNTPEDVSSYHYREWRAQNYLYKNQGLYPNSGINWVQRINSYGIHAGIYDHYTPLFTPKKWHFIYKIPRKW